MRRVNTALRQVLAQAVARELSDPRLGFVTITHVEATKDVREAKVWFTTLDPAAREPSQEALESARGVLQAKVAAELRAPPHPPAHLRLRLRPGGRGRPDRAHRPGQPIRNGDRR